MGVAMRFLTRRLKGPKNERRRRRKTGRRKEKSSIINRQYLLLLLWRKHTLVQKDSTAKACLCSTSGCSEREFALVQFNSCSLPIVMAALHSKSRPCSLAN